MDRNKSFIALCCSVAALAVICTKYDLGSEEKKENIFAYVACEDKRIYKIDLAKNEVILRSDEIRELGNPTAIDIDKKRGRLYVASERGHWQTKYSPIVVLDLSTLPIKVLNQFDLIVDEPMGEFIGVSAVYDIVVSPDGDSLYIGYAHPKYSGATPVVDSKTGEIIRRLDFIINKGSIFSPDGKEVAAIWPSGSRSIEKDGRKELREWSGGVAVHDIEHNKMISRKEVKKDKIGLYPPWGKIETPYVYLKDYKLLTMYNRDSEKIVSQIDLQEITKGLGTSNRYPLVFDKGEKAIISMIGENWQGYAVVIDLGKKEVIGKIGVGKYPTNPVLSNLEPKPSQ